MVKSIMDAPEQFENTDKTLWRSTEDMESVFVTKSGAIGLSYAGTVFVRTVENWVKDMEEFDRFRIALAEARARISKLEGYIADKVIEDDKFMKGIPRR